MYRDLLILIGIWPFLMIIKQLKKHGANIYKILESNSQNVIKLIFVLFGRNLQIFLEFFPGNCKTCCYYTSCWHINITDGIGYWWFPGEEIRWYRKVLGPFLTYCYWLLKLLVLIRGSNYQLIICQSNLKSI
jgi:hypothetical protein